MESRKTGIIAVKEDPFIQHLLLTLLGRRGYRAHGAPSSRVIQWIESQPESVDLIITNRPQEFAPLAYSVPVLHLSAAPDPLLAETFPMLRSLKKPFQNTELFQAVAELMEVAASV